MITLDERRRRVFDLYESGAYAREEFRERREEVENQIAAAKISLSECRIDELDVEGVLTYATTFIGNLPRQWFDLPQELRPRFQRLVFPEGIPYERTQGFGTAKLGFIYQLNLQFSGRKSHMVPLRGFSWNQLMEELKEFQQLKEDPEQSITA